MRFRRCVCGAAIPWRQTLCADCHKKYGSDRAKWPEWLRFWAKDTQREIDADRRHDEWQLFDGAEEPVDDRYPSEKGDGAIDAAWNEIRGWMTA